MSERIDRTEGRRVFGLDPAAYDAARPGHPPRVYEILVERCALQAGTTVLEVGPGTGQATRRLVLLGADPLVALEPNPALAAYLDDSLGARVDIWVVALEEAELPAAHFDVAVAASSFHWVEEEVGLEKLFDAVRPGGWVALWWTLFGEPGKPDAFIKATSPLLDNLRASPTRGAEGRPAHALDTEVRLGALGAAGFEDANHEILRWNASWDTQGIRALYGTFSPIARLDETRKTEILDGVAEIAERDFGGRVSRTLVTSLYTAHRPK
ncbi:MAG: class I SAM-dependent methyltransferase [Actinobacteria bacterium]|nr:class I SAM-dependent methyltransferase [Actinomycetota bacterium]